MGHKKLGGELMSIQDIIPGLGRRTEDNPPITFDDLNQPEGIENLIRSGRIPRFVENQSGDRNVICLIPPPGTQIGDNARSVGRPSSVAYAVEFISPGGESRGFAEIVGLSAHQATLLKPRIESAVNALKPSISTPPR